MPILQFKGKTAVENYHHTVPHHFLEFVPKLSCLEKGEEPSLEGNLILEGDNLLALKALLPTHAGRVKCIYIDPPYNTGNEGWVYNDNLTQPQFKEWIGKVVGKEEDDACRHEKWCCMMYPRLKLLRELLTDDGAIFISIDDNEFANLRMIMDEVFGPEARIATLIWRARNFADTRSKTGVSLDHEYILVYGKTIEGRLLGTLRDTGKYANPDNDPRGPWTSCSLLGKATKKQRPNLHYDITDPKSGILYKCPSETGWICGKPKFEKSIRENRILWPKRPSGRPREKIFLNELKSDRIGFQSVINGIYTSEGTESLREIFDGQVLAFPKPPNLIKDLVCQIAESGDIILDSFAGSGTTGHAVLSLNEEDTANRRFILVQQPYDTKENEKDKFNICEKITAERVRRVIKGYKFTGAKKEVLLEEKITLRTLKNSEELLARIEEIKERAKGFDEIKTECKNGTIRVVGIKNVQDKTEGLGGSFTYARVSEKPLLGNYEDIGKYLPPYEEIAKYIFYTETSRQWNKKNLDKKSGRIGEHAGVSYYLLYRPNHKEDWAIDMEFLRTDALNDPNRRLVVYCEKIWLHRSDLREWEKANKKEVRMMIVPFNLK